MYIKFAVKHFFIIVCDKRIAVEYDAVDFKTRIELFEFFSRIAYHQELR